MKYAVIISPEAENDLQDAFSWYEARRDGLGRDFLLQIDAALAFMARNPEAHPPEYKTARKHLIKRFPYKIVYLFEKQRIVVLAVIHGKRGPRFVAQRMNAIR
ncbi:MAG: type II toxin-antitoxin system RelE/ParE family toxin [Nitrospirae bacterium]|nr:type II toxin-antitoxin system RelE/ParE family toxin [Nitrospirota bacterium]